MIAVASTITDDELEQALARHPRIGERADAAKHDAELLDATSRPASTATTRTSPAGWRKATGPTRSASAGSSSSGPPAASAHEILDQLRLRMDNSDELERAETIKQLTQIALLRIREVLSR